MKLMRSKTPKVVLAALVAVVLAALGSVAQARDIHWSVGIHAPGVSVGVGTAAPVYVAPAPVYVAPVPVHAAPVYVAPTYYVQPAPVYYAPRVVHVHKPHHHRHGHRHGHRR